jgi:hypothetical protein
MCRRALPDVTGLFRCFRRSRPSAFFSISHAFLHGFCQLLLVLGQQRFNFVVRLVADRVDLRAEVFAGDTWILIEQRLDPVVVLLKQRSDLFPLVRGEFKILCQMIEFLIERPRAVHRRAYLIRPLLVRCIFLGHGNAGHPKREHASQPSVKKLLIDKGFRRRTRTRLCSFFAGDCCGYQWQ